MDVFAWHSGICTSSSYACGMVVTSIKLKRNKIKCSAVYFVLSDVSRKLYSVHHSVSFYSLFQTTATKCQRCREPSLGEVYLQTKHIGTVHGSSFQREPRCGNMFMHFSLLPIVVARGCIGCTCTTQGGEKIRRINLQEKFASAPQHTKCTPQAEQEQSKNQFL